MNDGRWRLTLPASVTPVSSPDLAIDSQLRGVAFLTKVGASPVLNLELGERYLIRGIILNVPDGTGAFQTQWRYVHLTHTQLFTILYFCTCQFFFSSTVLLRDQNSVVTSSFVCADNYETEKDVVLRFTCPEAGLAGGGGLVGNEIQFSAAAGASDSAEIYEIEINAFPYSCKN